MLHSFCLPIFLASYFFFVLSINSSIYHFHSLWRHIKYQHRQKHRRFIKINYEMGTLAINSKINVRFVIFFPIYVLHITWCVMVDVWFSCLSLEHVLPVKIIMAVIPLRIRNRRSSFKWKLHKYSGCNKTKRIEKSKVFGCVVVFFFHKF